MRRPARKRPGQVLRRLPRPAICERALAQQEQGVRIVRIIRKHALQQLLGFGLAAGAGMRDGEEQVCDDVGHDARLPPWD